MTFPTPKLETCAECGKAMPNGPYTYYEGKPFGTLYCYLQYKYTKIGYFRPKPKPKEQT